MVSNHSKKRIITTKLNRSKTIYERLNWITSVLSLQWIKTVFYYYLSVEVYPTLFKSLQFKDWKTSTSKGGSGEEFIRRFRTKLTFLFAQSHQNAVVEYAEKKEFLKVITRCLPAAQGQIMTRSFTALLEGKRNKFWWRYLQYQIWYAHSCSYLGVYSSILLSTWSCSTLILPYNCINSWCFQFTDCIVLTCCSCYMAEFLISTSGEQEQCCPLQTGSPSETRRYMMSYNDLWWGGLIILIPPHNLHKMPS